MRERTKSRGGSRSRSAPPPQKRDPWLLKTAGGAQFLNALTREMSLAVNAKRVGETSVRRLDWIVKFSQRDLTLLREEEVIALGHDVRAIAATSLSRGSSLTMSIAPMPAARVLAYQQEIAAGLTRLLGRKDGTWPLPNMQAVLCPTSGPRSPRRQYFRLNFVGDERRGLMGAVAQLIQVAGEHLRVCRECAIPFVATKRQEYCSPACSQRTRNRRRSD